MIQYTTYLSKILLCDAKLLASTLYRLGDILVHRWN